MRDIIYVCNLPLTRHRYDILFINELIEAGACVEYWDVSAIRFGKPVKLVDEIDSNVVVRIENVKDLRKRISSVRNRSVVFITDMRYQWRVLWFSLQRKPNAPIIYLERGTVPSCSLVASKRGVSERVKNLLSISPRALREKLLEAGAALLWRMRAARAFDVVIASGEECLGGFRGKCQVVECNHFDYDASLEKKSSAWKLDGEYAVFLGRNKGMDNDAKLSTDVDLLGLEQFDSRRYQALLNHFFAMIEDKFAVKVVVAGHPKSSNSSEDFNGRPNIKYRTPELIRDCKFVLAHDSTAISFAVLYAKPLILLSDECIGGDAAYVHAFAKELGACVYDMDTDCKEKISMPVIDADCYERYKYKFLTSPATEGRMSRDIYIDFLKRY